MHASRPTCFQRMIDAKVCGFIAGAQQQYRNLGKRGKDATVCTDCGLCEPKCPQNIEIRQQLKTTHALLGD
jgi:predicted aldo/keto reductase-like oxidoreductase